MSSTMLAGSVGALTVPLSGHAADLPFKAPPVVAPGEAPAVDGLNGKVDGFGGSISDRSVAGVKGAITAPLAVPYGIQIDAAAGSLDSRAFGSIGGHLFWRDPARALFGLYANHTHWDEFGGLYVTQVAGEGEYYFGRWTVAGIAGVEFGNSASTSTSATAAIPARIGIPGLATTAIFTQGFDTRTRFFDEINLKYYVTDNWDAYVGHRYLGGEHALALGTEAGFALSPGIMATAFLEGRIGEENFHGVWGGIRFYFGHDKPLIGRHRSEDPNNWSVDSLFSILNNQTQSVLQSSQVLPPLPPPCGGSC